jgi:hypothetical protein
MKGEEARGSKDWLNLEEVDREPPVDLVILILIYA